MGISISKILRSVRRYLRKTMQSLRERRHVRRAHAILLLHEGYNISEVSRLRCAARSAIGRWRNQFEQLGEEGLVPEPAGRKPETVTEELCAHLLALLQKSPNKYGYLRSRWTTEMLAEQTRTDLEVYIHASTVHRRLPRLGVYWNRARPTLQIPAPQKVRKMRAIRKALNEASESNPVFYVDEVDIDLNPRIGSCWTPKGQQAAISTPGKNQKRYLAGALNARTGKVVWVEWPKKNSGLFIHLLAELRKRYRRAKKIILIADNYIIHKSAMTECFLLHQRKFRILFQPVYHPWVNKIEQLWKQLHDTVTRNHRYSTMDKLMEAVRDFMSAVSPFPGARAQLARC